MSFRSLVFCPHLVKKISPGFHIIYLLVLLYFSSKNAKTQRHIALSCPHPWLWFGKLNHNHDPRIQACTSKVGFFWQLASKRGTFFVGKFKGVWKEWVSPWLLVWFHPGAAKSGCDHKSCCFFYKRWSRCPQNNLLCFPDENPHEFDVPPHFLKFVVQRTLKDDKAMWGTMTSMMYRWSNSSSHADNWSRAIYKYKWQNNK